MRTALAIFALVIGVGLLAACTGSGYGNNNAQPAPPDNGSPGGCGGGGGG